MTVVVGFGVVGMLQLLAAGTAANSDGAELSTGLHLARNIRELSLGLAFYDPQTPTNWGAEAGESLATYDDIDDLDGRVFSPPIDARRQTLSNYAGWQQSVVVRSVDPDLLTSAVPNGTTPANRVTVTVRRNGQFVCDLSWVVLEKP